MSDEASLCHLFGLNSHEMCNEVNATIARKRLAKPTSGATRESQEEGGREKT
jgi:hypothetical protein